MKKNFLPLFIVILFVLLSGNSEAQTTISGTLNANTTLTSSGSPYFIDGDVTIAENVTLTIEPGTILKFKDHYTDLWVKGSIKAIGNSTHPIYFTSYTDDAHGGDTNADGAATSPAKNQWGSVFCEDKSTANKFHYCWFGYGGGWSGPAMLDVRNSEAEVRNCTFTKSEDRGMHCEYSTLDIQNSTFSNNANLGLYYVGLSATKHSVLSNNQFLNNTNWAILGDLQGATTNITLIGNSGSGSKHNGFGCFGQISGSISMNGQSDFPFIVENQDLILNKENTLTISAGTTFKFDTHYTDFWIRGTIKAIGDDEHPIVFTSINDDTHGGDSNGNSNATIPEPDNWGGLSISEESSNNQFHHCWFGYGGGWSTYGILEVIKSDAEIRSCTFNASQSYGMKSEYSKLDIENCSFTNNQDMGLNFIGLDAENHSVLKNCSFENNINWSVLGDLKGASTNITLQGNTSTGSNRNGFGILGNISGQVTFSGQSDFPFIVYNSDIIIDENGGLTLSSGTNVKFETHYSDIWVNGKITAIGTAGAPIVFSSLADDAHGGDTNNDGTTTEPAGDQWGAIVLNSTSSSNRFHHCWFGYGGGWSSTSMLDVLSSDAEVRNCTFAHSRERGIYSEFSMLDIQNSTFKGNQTDGIYYKGLHNSKTSVLTANTFEDNVNWSVFGNLFDATSNIELVGNSSTGSKHNGFGMEGAINGNIFLKGQHNFPFIISGSDVTIRENKKVTVTQNTTFKFDGHYSDLWVNGTIIANGTATNPIIFTSMLDDARGGDTNGDDSATEPAPSSWSGISLTNKSAGNEFDNCWFGYAGGWSTNANLNVMDSEAKIRNCSFNAAEGVGLFSQNSKLDIEDCSFKDNTSDGLNFNGLHPSGNSTLKNCTFKNNLNWAVNGNFSNATSGINAVGNSSTGSGHNGFGIKGAIAGNIALSGQSDFPFIVGEDVTVNEGAKLNISEGACVKFDNHYCDLWVYGSLKAIGTNTNPIVFTSIRDDVHGGDTNGDSNTTEAAPDNWGGIILDKKSSANQLHHCWFAYGGGWTTNSNLLIYSSGTDILNSTITKGQGSGIEISESNPNIRTSVITENEGNGIFANNGALPVLKYNSIMNNTNYGVYNGTPTVDVDARNNWWGDASGPLHATKNPDGKGNKVSDYVLFDPWNKTTSVYDINATKTLSLEMHYPNPAFGNVIIPYNLSKSNKVSIQLINLDGKVLKTLLNETKPAGKHNLRFDSNLVTNGTYFIRLSGDDYFEVNRIIVLN